MSDGPRLLDRYLDVRRATERLCQPLAVEDYVVQAMPDVSPAKWHLAHVSWFFETFVLRTRLADYRPLDENRICHRRAQSGNFRRKSALSRADQVLRPTKLLISENLREKSAAIG